MPDSSAIIISAIQITFSVGAMILFLIGIFASIRDIQYINPDDPEDEMAHTRAAFKKSMIMIACGIFAFFVSRFCYNLPLMAPAGYGTGSIAMQALLDALTKTGLLLIFPFVFRYWRRNAQKKGAFRS